MGISYVGGATNNSGGANVAAITGNYTPTSGNLVFVFVHNNNSTSAMTVVDNNSNPLTSLVTNGVGSSPKTYCFYYTAGSGVTGFTANWTTSRPASIVVVEYSVSAGTMSVNTGNVFKSPSTGMTNFTTTGNNSWVIACLGDLSQSVTFIETGGGSRQSVTTANARVAVGDGTVASPGVVTVTFVTPAGGTMILVEVLFTATTSTSRNFLMMMGCGA
jgi:hypothetical protein